VSHPQAVIRTICVHKVTARIFGSQKGLHICHKMLSNCNITVSCKT